MIRTIILSVLLTPALLATAQTSPPPPVKLILVQQSTRTIHDVTKRLDGKPSVVEQTWQKLADETKLFKVEIIDDCKLLTPQKLKEAKIVALYTSRDVPLDVDAFTKWIEDGGFFIGTHTPTNTRMTDPKWHNVVDGIFDEHPWTSQTKVSIKTDEPPDHMHPAAKPFAPGDTFLEEIYREKDVNYDKIRVLISLDMEKTKLKYPLHVPIAWCKTMGKGKVFCTALGHRQDMWENPKYQQHLIGAVRWGLGLEEADVTPNPQVHVVEEELAKKATASTQPSAGAAK